MTTYVVGLQLCSCAECRSTRVLQIPLPKGGDFDSNIWRRNHQLCPLERVPRRLRLVVCLGYWVSVGHSAWCRMWR